MGFTAIGENFVAVVVKRMFGFVLDHFKYGLVPLLGSYGHDFTVSIQFLVKHRLISIVVNIAVIIVDEERLS